MKRDYKVAMSRADGMAKTITTSDNYAWARGVDQQELAALKSKVEDNISGCIREFIMADADAVMGHFDLDTRVQELLSLASLGDDVKALDAKCRQIIRQDKARRRTR